MRFFLFCATLITLVSCGETAGPDKPFGQAVQTFQQPEFDPRYVRLLQAEAPALQIGFPDRPDAASTLLLEQKRGDFAYWLGPDGGQLIFEKGILAGTRGVGEGFLAAELSEPIAHILGQSEGNADRLHTYLDGNDQAVTRTYRCEIRRGALTSIELSIGRVTARLVREACRSLTEDFTNLYWIDQSTGQIVLSRQWAGPTLKDISTRAVLR